MALYFVDPQPVGGAPGQVDTTALNSLGMEASGSDGIRYIYLQGIGSTLLGSWVTIGAAHVTALLATGANGRVAVASAAIGASQFGWYAIVGNVTFSLGSSNGTITSGGGQLQVGSTAGYVQAQGSSAGAAAGDYIFGAFAYSGQPSSADDIIASVFLNRPFIANAVAVPSS
jgi:hypothetical protein